jgi:hypothetical protein
VASSIFYRNLEMMWRANLERVWQRRYQRGAKGVEGRGVQRGLPLQSRLGGLEEHPELPVASGVEPQQCLLCDRNGAPKLKIALVCSTISSINSFCVSVDDGDIAVYAEAAQCSFGCRH